MAVEQMRGCGYRKVGGLYLCGEGSAMSCDRLPYELKVCPVCGSGIKFTRGFTWIDWLKYAGEHGDQCKDMLCPICWPRADAFIQPFGLLWVGEQFYSPESFIQEALSMGVSRRIAAVPKNLKLGETWILFAHKKAVPQGTCQSCGGTGAEYAKGGEEITCHACGGLKVGLAPGVFYASRPQRLELLIWESEATPEKLAELEKKGITPIIISDGDVDHSPETSLKPTDEQRNKLFFGGLRKKLRGV